MLRCTNMRSDVSDVEWEHFKSSKENSYLQAKSQHDPVSGMAELTGGTTFGFDQGCCP